MPTVDEVRALVAPRRLMAAPGMTRPKNDVLFVQVAPQNDAGDWYATLKFGDPERAMSGEEYLETVIKPALASR